jgi:hypothetical protein
MDIPPELLVLIGTKYLSSKIDQLSFWLSHEDHFLAFSSLAGTTELSRFCSEFQLNPKQDLEFSEVLAIYRGLQRLGISDNKKEISIPINLPRSKRYHYSIDRRRGYIDNANWRCSSATNSNTTSIVQQRIREQITSSTFAFDISSTDPEKFVLIHSLNGKAYSTVTLWPQCNSFHLPFEVMGQGLLIHQHLLFVMPLWKKPEGPPHL